MIWDCLATTRPGDLAVFNGDFHQSDSHANTAPNLEPDFCFFTTTISELHWPQNLDAATGYVKGEGHDRLNNCVLSACYCEPWSFT